MPTVPLARVLSVDDDIEAGEMLSLLLKAHGIEITCAHSALEACAIIKLQHFDLYLLDAWLPGLDGFELCRQLRVADSQTPILFYSGAAYDADKEQGINAGANAYIVKPEIETLIDMIPALIAQARVSAVAGGSVVPFRTQQVPVESYSTSGRSGSRETALAAARA